MLVEKVVVPGEPWETLAADLEPARAHRAELRLAVECDPAPEGGTLAGAVRWSVPTVYRPSTAGYTNVVVVTVDTLRADHLGAYGYARPTSPRIDGLARRGLLFRNAETVQSATWPALTSLHTSLYPSAHGVIWNGWRPRGRFVTLADLLHAKGYGTAAFLSNMTRAEHPGFSRVFRARGGDQVRQDEEAVAAAVRHLEEVRDRPFFLWLHLISPHADYAPPAAYDTYTTPGASTVGGTIAELEAARAKGVRFTEADVARVVALYDGEVAFTDAQVGRVLDALRDLRLQERTLVVFSADHGEDLHEHNRYFFHSPSLYSSSLHVPLILALPGVLPQGVETDHPASLVDVAPTVLSLLGLPFPSSFQGKRPPARGSAARRSRAHGGLRRDEREDLLRDHPRVALRLQPREARPARPRRPLSLRRDRALRPARGPARADERGLPTPGARRGPDRGDPRLAAPRRPGRGGRPADDRSLHRGGAPRSRLRDQLTGRRSGLRAEAST